MAACSLQQGELDMETKGADDDADDSDDSLLAAATLDEDSGGEESKVRLSCSH